MTLSVRRAAPLLLIGIIVISVVMVLRSLTIMPTSSLSAPQDDQIGTLGRPIQMLYRLEADSLAAALTEDRAWEAGRIWSMLGNPAYAAAFWEQADRTPSVLRALATAYAELGDWARANDVLQTLMSASTSADSAWASLQLGMIRAAIDPAEARSLLESAITLEPGYAESARDLIDTLNVTTNPTRIGMAFARMSQWALAERAFLHSPADPLAIALTGLTRDRQGKDGANYIEAAVTLAPADPQVRFVEGLYYRLHGDDQASLAAFIQLAALQPDEPMVYAELGVAYQRTGDLVTAEHWLKFALELSGGDPRYETMIDQLRTEEQDLTSALAAMMGDSFGDAFPPDTTTPTVPPFIDQP